MVIFYILDDRILSILNTGSIQDLQTLQRVGAKRASLIHRLVGHTNAWSFQDKYGTTQYS